MQNLTTILLLLGSMFMLSNCKDDCADKKILLKELYKYVPYSGTETLRFLHNSTDTQFFIGQGMERFYITTRKQEDGACPEDHESVRIRFINPKTKDEIKMEYVYDPMFGSQSSNLNTYYKFYYNNIFSGKLINILLPSSVIVINGHHYNTLGIFAFSNDTTSYILYRFPVFNEHSGILKIKYPGDTLTIIR